MNWNDSGDLLSKNKYNENSIIVEIFTKNHGKYSGIIFGASSKKIKSYLEIGNKLHINYTSKNHGRIGYFKPEILNATTPLYFDNRKKLMCIASAMNLIKLVTVEAQESPNIYYLIEGHIGKYHNENLIYSTLCSISYFKGFSIYRTLNISETFKFLLQFYRKIEKDKRIGYYDENNTSKEIKASILKRAVILSKELESKKND